MPHRRTRLCEHHGGLIKSRSSVAKEPTSLTLPHLEVRLRVSRIGSNSCYELPGSFENCAELDGGCSQGFCIVG